MENNKNQTPVTEEPKVELPEPTKELQAEGVAK